MPDFFISPRNVRTVRRWRQRSCALALSAAMALTSPTLYAEGLPELGDDSQTSFSPQMERKVGEQIFAEIRTREPSYIADPEVSAYLNRLGGRLSALVDGGTSEVTGANGFEFFALRDPTLNAFAMPGGYIGVHSGLLLSAQSESELASVLAHEISHVTQHHIGRSMSTAGIGQMAMLLSLAVAILAARSNPDMAMGAAMAGQAAGIQSKLNYSRDFEREADRVGLQLLERAGFDARAMPLFFNRMLKFGTLYDNNAPAYLRTHPLTTERISAIEDRIEGRSFKFVPDSLEFQLVRAKLRAAAALPRDAIGEFEGRLRDASPREMLIARYGLARAYLLDGDDAAAATQIRLVQQAASAQKLSSPMLDVLSAELLMRQRAAAAAANLLLASRAHYPQDRAINYLLIDACLAAGRAEDALKITREDLQLFPNDPQMHALQAKTYSSLGQHMQQHSAQAESYLLVGQLPQAILQLELAQKADDGNFYEHSQVEVRLQELKKRHLEAMKAKRSN
jgi:predicted Zn-dependent protease